MERGEKLEGIIDTGVGFFTPEEILKAKESLHKLMQFTTRCKIHAKDEENFTEICRWIHQAHAKKTKLPTFVIDSPCSVPTTSEATAATVAIKVNELSRVIKNHFAINANKPIEWPSASNQPDKPSYAIVLKNLPESLDTPSARKRFIDSVCADTSDISELRRVKSDWKLVVRSKNTAETIVESIKTNQPQISAAIKSPNYIGVVKRVPSDVSADELTALIPRATKSEQLGSSRTFKVFFSCRSDLDKFLKDSVKIYYEKLPTEEFLFLPRRCYSCHNQGHLAAECSNSPVCSRCGASDHVSKKNDAEKCTRAMFCVSCKKAGHTCYSVKCPKNQQKATH